MTATRKPGQCRYPATVFFIRVRKQDSHLTTNAYHLEGDTYEGLKEKGGTP